jgi:MPBQ/MSBQ methyltransferase
LVSLEESVSGHYTHGRLAEAILAALRKVVADPENITPDDLAPVDEFHIGGREATVRFIGHLGFGKGMQILDIGSGIGGTARYVAANHGCHVTGIDVTPEYCEVATLLTQKVGLAHQVTYQQGSALAIAADDQTFDGVYMVHVGMNIADKATLFREVRRVLKPSGVFGVYDILEGPAGGDLVFPVPWSAMPENSFLLPIDEIRRLLYDAGFEIKLETDRTEFALEFFQRLQQQAGDGAPSLGLHILMGEGFKTKVANMVRNVAEGRCAPWEIVCRRRTGPPIL